MEHYPRLKPPMTLHIIIILLESNLRINKVFDTISKTNSAPGLTQTVPHPPHPPSNSTHPVWQVLVLVVQLQVDGEQLLEGPLHLLSVSQREVTQDQVKPCLEARGLRHDVLEWRDRVRVLTHLHKHDTNVLHDLRPAIISINYLSFMITLTKLIEWSDWYFWSENQQLENGPAK